MPKYCPSGNKHKHIHCRICVKILLAIVLSQILPRVISRVLILLTKKKTCDIYANTQWDGSTSCVSCLPVSVYVCLVFVKGINENIFLIWWKKELKNVKMHFWNNSILKTTICIWVNIVVYIIKQIYSVRPLSVSFQSWFNVKVCFDVLPVGNH